MESLKSRKLPCLLSLLMWFGIFSTGYTQSIVKDWFGLDDYAPAVRGSIVGSFTWDDGTGPALMAYGYFPGGIARWDGVRWRIVGDGVNGIVFSAKEDDAGRLVVAGIFTEAGGIAANNVARWDGYAWSALGAGLDAPGFYFSVEDLIIDGNRIYAGSGFQNEQASFSGGSVSMWDGTEWQTIGGFDDRIQALAMDSDGNLFAGGYFVLSRWDGVTWEPVGGGISSGTVHSLVINNSGDLIVGGEFNSVGNGTSATNIARWDGSDWSALGTGTGRVYTMALEGSGNLLAAGLGGGIQRWDGATWTTPYPAFNTRISLPSVLGLNVDESGVLTASGQFDSTGGQSVDQIAQWDGVSWNAIHSTGLDGPIRSLAADDSGNVYVSGNFSRIGNAAADGIATWNGDSWSPMGANLEVNAWATTPHGVFAAIGATVRRWDGMAWVPLGQPFVGGEVLAVAVDVNGNVYAGGTFDETAGGVALNFLALWDGNQWQPITSEANGGITALVIDAAGDLIAAGGFSAIGGIAARRIARWDGGTWHPLGEGIDDRIRSLVASNTGNVFAGGDFTEAGNVFAQRIARWDGVKWHRLLGGVGSTVSALALDPSGNLFVGGRFETVGPENIPSIAKWNSGQWSGVGNAWHPAGIRFLASDAAGDVFVDSSALRLGGLKAVSLSGYGDVQKTQSRITSIAFAQLGSPSVISAEISAATAPTSGVLSIVGKPGGQCTDVTLTPLDSTRSQASCEITFNDPGPYELTAYYGSSANASGRWSASESTACVFLPAEAIFSDSFESNAQCQILAN